MNSTIRSFIPSNNFTMPPQQQQQYQAIYVLCNSLKKDYDATTDPELKAALKTVLNSKIASLQSIWSAYTSTINVQISSVIPQ